MKIIIVVLGRPFLVRLISCFFMLSLVGCSNIIMHKQLHAPVFHDIGNLNYKISTKSYWAQKYFDQGLSFFYGFNFNEAERSFEAATIEDPKCAMCYWGLSLSLGSKFNTYMNGRERQKAIISLTKALNNLGHITSKEQDLVYALAEKYSLGKEYIEEHHEEKHDHSSHHHPGTIQIHDIELENYSKAMKKLMNKYKDDNEIAALYVVSMFDHKKWGFWNKDKSPTPDTIEMLWILENIISNNPNHFGAHHFYIHMLEPSAYPEKAYESADILDKLAPEVEHIVHMPSHIFFTLGYYHRAKIQNIKALKVFDDFNNNIIKQGFPLHVHFLYIHDVLFLWAAAMMDGDKDLSLQSANRILHHLNINLLYREPRFYDIINAKYETMLNFGLWEDILLFSDLSLDNDFLKMAKYYAKLIANIQLNKIDDAYKNFNNFKNIYNNTEQNTDYTIMINYIAEAKIKELENKDEEAVICLLKAVEIEDSIELTEPPKWLISAKRILGHTYYRKGYYREAIQVFEKDLKMFRQNAWAYLGLANSYKSLNDEENYEIYFKLYKDSWQHSDTVEPIFF